MDHGGTAPHTHGVRLQPILILSALAARGGVHREKNEKTVDSAAIGRLLNILRGRRHDQFCWQPDKRRVFS